MVVGKIASEQVNTVFFSRKATPDPGCNRSWSFGTAHRCCWYPQDKHKELVPDGCYHIVFRSDFWLFRYGIHCICKETKERVSPDFRSRFVRASFFHFQHLYSFARVHCSCGIAICHPILMSSEKFFTRTFVKCEPLRCNNSIGSTVLRGR